MNRAALAVIHDIESTPASQRSFMVRALLDERAAEIIYRATSAMRLLSVRSNVAMSRQLSMTQMTECADELSEWMDVLTEIVADHSAAQDIRHQACVTHTRCGDFAVTLRNALASVS